MPDWGQLADQQIEAVGELMNYIDGSLQDVAYMSIEGFAGTGKTFMITRFLEWLLVDRKLVTAVTAPTNKAVRVLKDMCPIKSTSLEFITIHKLLGLRERTLPDGKKTFEPDKNAKASLGDYKVVIVDETSLLNQAVYMYLHEAAKREKTKIIFVGDPCQIPPVGEQISPVMMGEIQYKHHIRVNRLTHIHRQAEGNPILSFATSMREHRDDRGYDFTPFYESEWNDSGARIGIPREERALIHKLCDVYFNNDIFKNYPDFTKAVAWRNDVVNAINAVVRELIYKEQAVQSILVGEKLVADAPVMEEKYGSAFKRIIINNNDELEVLSYTVKRNKFQAYVDRTLYAAPELSYYEALVHNSSTGQDVPIRIIHDESKNLFDGILADLEKEAKAKNKNYNTRFEALAWWRGYYGFKEHFAEVKYNYALTAHKAQGSTFRNVIMVDWDMRACPQLSTSMGMRYVGATRASHNLFLIH